jgi:hypothetical protein
MASVSGAAAMTERQAIAITALAFLAVVAGFLLQGCL